MFNTLIDTTEILSTAHYAKEYLNPFLLDLTVTKWTCVSSYIILHNN